MAWLQWPNDSVAVALRRAHAELSELRALPHPDLDLPGHAPPHPDVALQRTIYNNIRQHHRQDLQQLLVHRWARWQRHLGHPMDLKAAIRRAPTFLINIAGIVPPCVQHAVMATWLNGWCTARRFQEPVKSCRLHPGCQGADELEHYACCRHLCNCAARFLRIPAQPASLAKFLGVDGRCPAPPAAIAVHMYIARAVVHRVHLDRVNVAGSDDLQHLYRERLRHLFCTAGELASVIPRP